MTQTELPIVNTQNIIIGGFLTNSDAIAAARKLGLKSGTYKIVRDGRYINIVEAK